VPTGFARLDAHLPGGGWPHPALIEVLNDRAGIGELSLLLPALRHLSEGQASTIAWFNPPHLPYPPALAEHGLGHTRQLVSRPLAGPKALWAMEQALRSGACAAVLAWTEAADAHAIRRLKLAATEGGCLGFLFRSSRHRLHHSPATVRLALAAEGAVLVVELMKVQGGRAATLRLSPH
jgi:cell division inhibitor SulA/protein ImuA